MCWDRACDSCSLRLDSGHGSEVKASTFHAFNCSHVNVVLCTRLYFSNGKAASLLTSLPDSAASLAGRALRLFVFLKSDMGLGCQVLNLGLVVLKS